MRSPVLPDLGGFLAPSLAKTASAAPSPLATSSVAELEVEDEGDEEEAEEGDEAAEDAEFCAELEAEDPAEAEEFECGETEVEFETPAECRLTSAEASYVTGSALGVDGGSAWH